MTFLPRYDSSVVISVVGVTATFLLLLGSLPSSFGQLTNILRSQVPVQTFFVPIPESHVYERAFKVITAGASGTVQTILGISITTDNTVIWYDHWEEGYELDITKPIQRATQIWGDGTASNGCAPPLIGTLCTDAADVLRAGQTIQIQNGVPVIPERGTSIVFDGGDMIYSSFPITISRAGFAENPGSVLGGACEVYDVGTWGTVFEMPVGVNVGMEAFQLTTAFIMASKPTAIEVNGNGRPIFVDKGKSVNVNVTNQGMMIIASNPVQVHLVTGDVASSYEMRWFSLMPNETWSNDYTTSVGDSQGKTKFILYNANPSKDIVINMEYLVNGTIVSAAMPVQSKKHHLSPVIPLDSGARVRSIDPFLALSFTDTERYAGDGSQTDGNMYDWGFPVVPTNMLTPQVVIGLGFGCTNNNCPSNEVARSPIWIAPIDDAFVFIDYTNSGNASRYDVRRVKQYQSIRIRSNNTKKDMSGALIFATKWDGTLTDTPNPNGIPVDIAAAWGQDPSVSTPNQGISLDMGTVVTPFTTIRVSKYASVQSAIPGSRVTYTIRIQNVGQTNIRIGKFQIVDPYLDSANYVLGSTKYSADSGITSINIQDDRSGTPFPLDDTGLSSLYELGRRGGTHEVSFDVIIDPLQVNKTSIINTGWVNETGRPLQYFKVEIPLLFLPSITIQNTVYLGQDGGLSCSKAVETVSGSIGTGVTYCFLITNTGNTMLQVNITDPLVQYDLSRPGVIKPGESFLVSLPRSIGTESFTNFAIAEGQPLFPNGEMIPYMTPVRASDPSRIEVTIPFANVTIRNTVLAGSGDKVAYSCIEGGNETYAGILGDEITYCLKVTNTGNTFLGSVTTANPLLDNYIKLKDNGPLAPGSSFTMAIPKSLLQSLENVATVMAQPVLVDGTPITELQNVTATDPSNVILLTSRSETKPPITPPGTTGTVTKCMDPHWKDSNKTQDLQCKAKEVYLDNIYNSERITCVQGTKIKVDIRADIIFRTTRYDPAFFVALDGGDAMKGTCLLKGLEKNIPYKVVDPDDNTTVVGKVLFDSDHFGGNDSCGDVIMDVGGGGKITTSIVNTEMLCNDRDGDGSFDFAICFSWRVPGTDGVCTLTNNDPKTLGSLADVYPGTPSKCFCQVYDVPDIDVDPPGEKPDLCVLAAPA